MGMEGTKSRPPFSLFHCFFAALLLCDSFLPPLIPAIRGAQAGQGAAGAAFMMNASA